MILSIPRKLGVTTESRGQLEDALPAHRQSPRACKCNRVLRGWVEREGVTRRGRLRNATQSLSRSLLQRLISWYIVEGDRGMCDEKSGVLNSCNGSWEESMTT